MPGPPAFPGAVRSLTLNNVDLMGVNRYYDGRAEVTDRVPGQRPIDLEVEQAQLAAAEAKLTDLHEQMLVSSELIKALADQNTQLIKRIEVNRIRVLWLAGIMVVLTVVAVINLAIWVVYFIRVKQTLP